jgi:uncharacterized protein (DUF2225 family)
MGAMRGARQEGCETDNVEGMRMTTLRAIQFRCPVCTMQFTSRAVDSTDSLGGEQTDFHTRAVTDLQPLPYLVHLCPRCGYAGTEDGFSEDATVDRDIEDRVWNELAPKLDGDTPIGSEKYEFAAKIATWRGESPRRVGELWLRAAWCCADDGDTEAERYYRRFAVLAFEESLARDDGIDKTERAILTYLVGELWRRIGDDARAARWFDRVRGEVTNAVKEHWLVEAAKQQKEAPRDWFRRR